nr:MAG TPA: hypothetical protein [Caudoviricetes sp.]
MRLNRVQLIAQDLRTHTNGSGHIFQIVRLRKRSASCIKMCMFRSLIIKHSQRSLYVSKSHQLNVTLQSVSASIVIAAMLIITFSRFLSLRRRWRLRRPSESMSFIVSIDNPVSSLYFSTEIEGTAKVIEIC